MATRRINGIAITVALLLPSLITWVYFVALADTPAALQQGVYAVGKAIQFGLPVAWVFFYQRRRLVLQRPGRDGLGLGLAFGLMVAVAMAALYHLWLKPSGFFEGPGEAVREKISGLGLSSPVRYVAVGLFYALCHSFLEEYYWRWFVFRELRELTSLGVAITISSLGFMAHHVILLAIYFGWTSPATYLFSLSVAIGGAAWAAIYHRSGSLYGPWLSHCLVDAAIFLIGYDLARDLLVG